MTQPYTDADLATVITTDPGALGCAPTKGDAQNAALLNATSANFTAYGSVSLSKLLQWAGSPSGTNTPLQAINAYIASTGADPRMVGICQAALQIFTAGTSLDLSDSNNFNPAFPASGSPGLVQILAGSNNWGAGGAAITVISAAQLSALVALGSQNPASYAAQRWGMGTVIDPYQIRRAFGRAG